MDVTRMPTSTFVTDAERETLVRGLAASRRLVVLLVYEGALAPLAPGPDGVAPDDDLREVLRTLGTNPGVEAHVLSGHRRDVLERWMGDLPVSLHAENGFWSRPVPDPAAGAVWTPLSETPPPWKIDLRALLTRFASSTPGAILEEKTASLAWHYAMVDPEIAASRVDELRRALEGWAHGLPVELIDRGGTIEVRLAGVNDGVVVGTLDLGREGTATLAIGGAKDEELFRALPKGAVAFVVGAHTSMATLEDPGAARRLLREIVARRSAR